MTDNEIIKALECCSKSCDNGYANCVECPRFVESSGCTLRAMKDALDLINRQKAEIERLQEENKTIRKLLEKDGITNVKFSSMSFDEYNKGAKAEAVKEFAERLKEKMRNCAMYCTDEHTYYLIGYSLIDNLLKEMVERG